VPPEQETVMLLSTICACAVISSKLKQKRAIKVIVQSFLVFIFKSTLQEKRKEIVRNIAKFSVFFGLSLSIDLRPWTVG